MEIIDVVFYTLLGLVAYFVVMIPVLAHLKDSAESQAKLVKIAIAREERESGKKLEL